MDALEFLMDRGMAQTASGRRMTMAEYVKREYAIDAVLDVYYDTPDIDLSGEKFEAAIFKIPAADVAPVRHGRWKCRGDCGVTECSACGWSIEEYVGDYDYCPNCGAKMD